MTQVPGREWHLKTPVSANDLVSLSWGRSEFQFDLKDGDIGDYWYGFEVGDHEYDLSVWFEETGDIDGNAPLERSASIYPIINAQTQIDKTIETDIEMTGDYNRFVARRGIEPLLPG